MDGGTERTSERARTPLSDVVAVVGGGGRDVPWAIDDLRGGFDGCCLQGLLRGRRADAPRRAVSPRS